MAKGDKSFTSGNKYVRIMAKGGKSFITIILTYLFP
jgi:hypothetical protein